MRPNTAPFKSRFFIPGVNAPESVPDYGASTTGACKCQTSHIFLDMRCFSEAMVNPFYTADFF